MKVEVVYCPRPGAADRSMLELPEGATLAEALVASGVLGRHGLALDDEQLKTGVWCRAQPLQAVLREHDRVELYRPLQVDPKEARRQRYRKHKA